MILNEILKSIKRTFYVLQRAIALLITAIAPQEEEERGLARGPKY
jgi:hypothetical protein